VEVIMKNVLNFVLFLFAMLTVGGCEIAGDIFKAGVWVGVLLVVLVVGGIIWMVSRSGA
jgi:hypothetical protein